MVPSVRALQNRMVPPSNVQKEPSRARFFPGVNAPFTTTLSSPVSSLVS